MSEMEVPPKALCKITYWFATGGDLYDCINIPESYFVHIPQITWHIHTFFVTG